MADSGAAAVKPKTKVKLQIAHSVPGRIRMKLPKGDPDLLEQVKKTFEVVPGIERVTVNPLTGSIVLNYCAEDHDHFHDHLHHHCAKCDHELHRRPSNEIDQLADKIEREAEFLAQHSQSARATVDFFKDLDKKIKLSTNNAVDLKIVLAAGVIAITLFEVGATAATPVWVTIAIFGMNHLVEMQPRRQGDPVQAPSPAPAPDHDHAAAPAPV